MGWLTSVGCQCHHMPACVGSYVAPEQSKKSDKRIVAAKRIEAFTGFGSVSPTFFPQRGSFGCFLPTRDRPLAARTNEDVDGGGIACYRAV